MEREKLLNMILFVHLAFYTEVFFLGGGGAPFIRLLRSFQDWLSSLESIYVYLPAFSLSLFLIYLF